MELKQKRADEYIISNKQQQKLERIIDELFEEEIAEQKEFEFNHSVQTQMGDILHPKKRKFTAKTNTIQNLEISLSHVQDMVVARDRRIQKLEHLLDDLEKLCNSQVEEIGGLQEQLLKEMRRADRAEANLLAESCVNYEMRLAGI